MKKENIATVLIFSVLILSMTNTVVVAAENEIPRVVKQVAENKDFFRNLKGYDQYKLNEVRCLNFTDEKAVQYTDKNMIGVILYDSMEYEYTMIFDVKSNKIVYRNVAILPKMERERNMRESIKMTDAVKIAEMLFRHEKK